MAFFNYATMQMAAKIVYYGPGLCGKTTNLQYIYNKTSPKSRGEMVSLETESDRTLFFDLLPLEVGVIAGFKTRFQLYTVPGQVFYGETRRMVLKGVDGVVFVADSQTPMRDANVESLKDLEGNLKAMGLNLMDIPIVLQYNKRDLPNILPVEEIEKDLNRGHWPSFESSAVNGMGVFDTLKGISRLTLAALKNKIARPAEPISQPAAMAPQRTAAAPAGPAPAAAVAPAKPAPAVTPAPAPDVEFSLLKTQVSDKELALTAPKLKTVSTTSIRVASELDRIRESLLGPILATSRPKVKDLSPTLDDIKKESQAAAMAGDISVEVPPEFLKELQGIHMEINFTDGKKRRVLPGGVLLASHQLQKTPDGWVVKLKFLPKKA
jgi:signal recognition particle receptor subunit beta